MRELGVPSSAASSDPAMRWYLENLRKYAVFAGRARRREYWTFALWNFLILAVLVFIAIAGAEHEHSGAGLVVLLLYALAIQLPGHAGLVRRLHDTNHSGYWFFIGLVPLVGSIILLGFLLKDSDPGPNRFGPNPKEEPKTATSPEMGYLAPPLPPDRR